MNILLALCLLLHSAKTVFMLCNSKIYCDGELLHAVQLSNIHKDSKIFVDMPTKFSAEKVLENFAQLKNKTNKAELVQFLNENFHESGFDTIKVEPVDWATNPLFIQNIKCDEFRNMARTLNTLWKSLLRKFDRKKICEECETSALHTTSPFVVPGGRFIEYYYWDTYWIIEGLLISEMSETARGILENFLEIVQKIGFVPNGARVYYLNRSQPPLLTQMINLYFEHTQDRKFLSKSLNLLDKEYEFWMKEKSVLIRSHLLNIYFVNSSMPRPESYKEDYENAAKNGDQTEFYSNIITGAESGWDFSSRWLENPLDLKTIQIRDIIPVDLNSIMYKNEFLLRKFHSLFNNTDKSDKYNALMLRREKAINEILFDKQLKRWGDFNMKKKRIQHKHYLYPSDLTPLWAGLNSSVAFDTLESYKTLLMKYPSGIPASSVHTHEQWDLFNIWAPYHDWIVSLLISFGQKEQAKSVAQRFLNTVYCGWKKYGNMFEKYDAERLGEYGQGGEYVVQEGFGWTNAVAIKFLRVFGSEKELKATIFCDRN